MNTIDKLSLITIGVLEILAAHQKGKREYTVLSMDSTKVRRHTIDNRVYLTITESASSAELVIHEAFSDYIVRLDFPNVFLYRVSTGAKEIIIDDICTEHGGLTCSYFDNRMSCTNDNNLPLFSHNSCMSYLISGWDHDFTWVEGKYDLHILKELGSGTFRIEEGNRILKVQEVFLSQD